MKFQSAPDDSETGLINRLVSESGLVEIGIYRVLFGSRIRAGFVGDPVCQIDWCCGDVQHRLWSHYVAIYLILSRRDETTDCFQNIPPTSVIKPCWKDEKFEQRLTDIMLDVPGVLAEAAP